LVDLRVKVLEQLLSWATFSDQLAAAFEADQKALDKLRR
jgi:hypothetical protein